MSNEEYSVALYEKICAEQEKSDRSSVREKLKSTLKNNSPKISAKFHGQEH